MASSKTRSSDLFLYLTYLDYLALSLSTFTDSFVKVFCLNIVWYRLKFDAAYNLYRLNISSVRWLNQLTNSAALKFHWVTCHIWHDIPERTVLNDGSPSHKPVVK